MVTVDLRMLTGLVDETGRMASLIRRLQLLKLIDHDSVLSSVASSLDGEFPFIAMEPAAAESLLARGAEGFKSEPLEALRLLEKLADGIGVVHRVGLIHGALSPASVFVGESPQIDLLQIRDGLNGKASDGTLDQSPVSGFQDSSEDSQTPASDIFSLNAILCWMLTGAAPPGVVGKKAQSKVDFEVTRDCSADVNPEVPVDDELPFADTENEPPINWTDSEVLRAAERVLRPFLCQMLHGDEFLRPPAQRVAKKKRAIITMLTESVCDETMNSAPDHDELSDDFEQQDSEPEKPTELGRFRIHEALGQGGMGSVYRAEDLADGQIVALKTLRRSIAAKPQNRRRFIKADRHRFWGGVR